MLLYEPDLRWSIDRDPTSHWGQFDTIARLLFIAVAVVVEVFATLRYGTAGRVVGGFPQLA